VNNKTLNSVSVSLFLDSKILDAEPMLQRLCQRSNSFRNVISCGDS